MIRKLLCHQHPLFRSISNIINPKAYNSSSAFINRLDDRQPSQKISALVDTIVGLSLLETADLVKLLKAKLNLPDAPMMIPMSQGVNLPTSQATATKKEETTATPQAEVKTEFQVTLVKYDTASKAKIIREVKNLMPGMSLVEAKTFVESVPKVLKEKIKKDEAESLKKLLEELGATIKLD